MPSASTSTSSTSTTMTSESISHHASITTMHTVQCANSSSLSKIPSPMKLGALDQQVFPIIPVAVVFVYDADEKSPGDTIAVDKLQTALSHLLDYYPHLTGRLHIDSTTGTRSIDRLGSGMHLHVAQCSSRLDALTSHGGRLTLLDLPDGGNALLAPYEPTLEAVCSDRTPILSVQHTRFACGGVALGLRVLHTVVDSDAFFQLARDLAEVYRSADDGSTPLANPPPLEGYLADKLDDGMAPEEREEALKYKPTLFFAEEPGKEAAAAPEQTVKKKKGESAPPPPPPVTGRTMRFTSAQLARLKAAAKDTADAENGWVSTYDALSALVWTRTHHARVQLKKSTMRNGEDNDDEQLPSRDYLTSVNYRTRLHLPPRYPFNAVYAPYTTLPHDALVGPDPDACLRAAARAVHALTRSVGPDEAAATARWMAAQPDKRRIQWGFNGGYGSTMISAWNKFDVYVGTDFEDGRPPVLVAPPFTPISLADGLGYYLPTEEQQDGGIDFYLALSEPVWGVLEEDEVWLRYRR